MMVDLSANLLVFYPASQMGQMDHFGLSLSEFRVTENAFILWLAYLCLTAAAIPALLFAFNVWLFRRPRGTSEKGSLPPISILIPARNEEFSIAAAIDSVLASEGVDFELIVLDDGSTDRTADLVRIAGEQDLRVRLASCPPLPVGWNGKQHACWVLASLAANDVFCFLDADVCVRPGAMLRMLSEMSGRSKGKPEMALVSGFPRQLTETFLEKLLLPLIHFVLLGFLPLPGERWTGYPGFAAGCGQAMMVRREPYFESGGHSSIRTTMHDGLLLPQLFRKHGFRTRVFDLSQDAVCRMYRSAEEVWRGLSKNATEGMAAKSRIGVFTVLLLFGQVLPLLVTIAAWIGRDSQAFRLASLALALGYGIRTISAWRYGQSWVGAALHPMGVLVLLVLQWSAFADKAKGRASTWKQRAYPVK